jgi:DNA-binding NarL/FixJ family response regulator
VHGGMELETTSVVLADDHPMVRAGIRNLLNKAPDILVVGEASDSAEALRLAKDLTPDVLLLDMEMPVLKGIEVARMLRAVDSPVRILALSAYNDKQYILGMLATGAAGYLTKEEVPETIIEAVRGVARGEDGWISQSIAARIGDWNERENLKNVELTAREREVLYLVTEGKTNQEIASHLGISKKTVEKHLGAVFTKLGVNSRVEAVEYVLKKKLL